MSTSITINVQSPQDLQKVHRALAFLVEHATLAVENSSVKEDTVTHDLEGVIVVVTYSNKFLVEVRQVKISAAAPQQGQPNGQDVMEHLVNHLANV